MQETKRPEEQTQLFCHEEAENLLLDLWHKNVLAGSWLFYGPQGIGKASLAYRLAKFILSQPNQEKEETSLFGISKPEKPSSLALSETHPTFKLVAQQAHPGLKVIECALKDEELKSRQSLIDSGKTLDDEVEKKRKRFNEIRVTDVREAESFLRLTAASNGWRVMIIDAADDMNPNAANALLKSLEEPPPQTLIILISHFSEKLLPTIVSRCRKLHLKPLKNSKIEELLKQKHPDISDKELKGLLYLSQGRLGQAFVLKERDAVFLFEKILDFFKNFPNLPVTDLYTFVEKNLKEKETLKIAQEILLQWLAKVCVSTYSNERTFFSENEAEAARNLNSLIPTLKQIELIEDIQKTFQDIDLDRKQIFVNAFLKLQKEAL